MNDTIFHIFVSLLASIIFTSTIIIIVNIYQQKVLLEKLNDLVVEVQSHNRK